MHRWFDIKALKHSIIPKVTYTNIYENSVDPTRLFQVDEVDAVDLSETVDLSVRNILWARGPGRKKDSRSIRDKEKKKQQGDSKNAQAGSLEKRSRLKWVETTSHALLDAEATMRLFTQTHRDNMSDRFSELDLDLSFYPLKYLALRTRNFLDPNRNLEHLLNDNSVTVQALPDKLFFSLGQRARRRRTEFYYARVGLQISQKYFVDSYYGFDPGERQHNDLEVRLVRFFHRFAVEMSYAYDAGEDDNHTVSFNLYPVELLDNDWDKRLRQDFR